LKYSLNGTEVGNNTSADYYVYLCIDRQDFANQVLMLKMIEDRTLVSLILFSIALVFVVFITYG